MAKLPYMQFFPSDYSRDTRCLSLAARGVWMDVLCTLWNAPKRGQKTLTLEGWAGEIGKPEPEVSALLLDLESNGIGKFIHETDGKLTIISRRMIRDERERKGAAKRKQYQRDKSESRFSHTVSHSDVTGIYQKSEDRSKKEEEKKSAPVRATVASDEEFWESLKVSPAYRHVNFEIENGKMDVWLALPQNKHRMKTRKFILNWLNKVEKPVTRACPSSEAGCQARVQHGMQLKPCGKPVVGYAGKRPVCQGHKEEHDARRNDAGPPIGSTDGTSGARSGVVGAAV